MALLKQTLRHEAFKTSKVIWGEENPYSSVYIHVVCSHFGLPPLPLPHLQYEYFRVLTSLNHHISINLHLQDILLYQLSMGQNALVHVVLAANLNDSWLCWMGSLSNSLTAMSAQHAPICSHSISCTAF